MYAPHANIEDIPLILIKVAVSSCSYRHIRRRYIAQRDFDVGILPAVQTRCEDVIRDDSWSILAWIPDLRYVPSDHERHITRRHIR